MTQNFAQLKGLPRHKHKTQVQRRSLLQKHFIKFGLHAPPPQHKLVNLNFSETILDNFVPEGALVILHNFRADPTCEDIDPSESANCSNPLPLEGLKIKFCILSNIPCLILLETLAAISRVNCTDYCTCGKCKPMPTADESTCCKEMRPGSHLMIGRLEMD